MAKPILIEIIGDDASLNKALSRGAKNTQQFGKTAEESGKKVGGLGRTVKHAAIALGGFFAAEKVFEFGKEAVLAAAQTQKATESIRQNFGKAADEVIDFNDKAAERFGISIAAASQFSTQIGLMTTNIGLGSKRGAEMTIGLEKLAGAVGLIKGQNPADSFAKLNKALLGNTRGLKDMGIAITPLAQKQEALRLGIKGSSKDWTAAQRANVIYGIAIKHLPTLMKQAEAHSGDLANQTLKLKAEFSNIEEEVGAKLLPVLTELFGLILHNKETVKDIAIVVAALAAAFLAWEAAAWLSSIATASLSDSFIALGFAMAANPVGAIVVGVIALGAALVIAYQRSATFRHIVQTAMRIASEGIDFVVKHWKIFLAMIPGVGIVLVAVITHWKRFKQIVGNAIQFVRDHWHQLILLLGPVGLIIDILAKHWQGFKNIVVGVIQTVIRWVGKISGKIGAVADAMSGPANTIKGYFDDIIGAIQHVIDWIGRIHFPSPPGWLSSAANWAGITGATGGIVTRPTLSLIGESGPEAVIPLNRAPGASPLPQVSLGGGGTQVDLYIDGRRIGTALGRANTSYQRHNGRGFLDG